jgi:hypothetical protein
LIFKEVYQTLEDRSDPDYVENHGPFLCNRKNAWLSSGFYFWESYLDNAHWWGAECNKSNYRDGYIICEAAIEYEEEKCFNLADNESHLAQLRQAASLLRSKGIPENQITVGNAMQFLKDKIDSFNYDGVRAKGERVRLSSSKYSNPLFYTPGGNPYIDLNPPIQICLFTKKSLGQKNYRVIFPEEYVVEDYTI